ncbi:hypothetical protein A5724_26945 [Mycobacterium sp. ACS1612]|uniref:hypothetical protein n=1 Tax=Mycobacterium sp. ACS1612 TaxID=1834117 RepID=UPI0007FCBF7A|nr:hypothetical protein [Mycobacterium sp. ACS1612]OBF29022.1 hypothetical protein A5724_26945 [Mycobacterium sp. ACS1612]
MVKHVPTRLRLRRRLLLFSAPVVVATLLTAAKLISAVIAGHAAAIHFADGQVPALRTDVSTMRIVNVVEPAKASFAAGTLAVLEGRLDEADARFSEALAGADPGLACEGRVNLELVRERQGDLAAWEGRPDAARGFYTGALGVIGAAPGRCFAGNADPDPERRAIRDDAANRLNTKIANLGTAPLAPPPPPASPPPAPPAGATTSPQPDEPTGPLRLNPGAGDPIEKLRQLLQDAAG